MIEAIDVREKFGLFQEHWSPKILASLNGQWVKAVRFQGEFVWHRHTQEDELFLVVHGSFELRYRTEDGEERVLNVSEGQFVVVPHGTDHCPYAEEECCALLFEPATTLNTGDVRNDRTLDSLEAI